MWCPSPPEGGGKRHLVTVPPRVGGNRRPWGGDGHRGGGRGTTLSKYGDPVSPPVFTMVFVIKIVKRRGNVPIVEGKMGSCLRQLLTYRSSFLMIYHLPQILRGC